MTLKKFLFSPAGKGTVGIFLTSLFLAVPPALSWVTAAIVLSWAVWHLREAFRLLEEATSNVTVIVHEAEPVINVPARRNGHASDMGVVVASVAAPKNR
jgi:Co/Zn/Cd efflux system component